MSETELFLSLLVDADGIVTSQKAQTPGEVQLAVCAAPSTVSYITCGTGANIEAGTVPIDTWGSSDLTMNSNIFYLSGLEAKDIKTTTFHSDNVTTSCLTLEVGDACPIPNPFGYIQLDADDVLSSDEKNLGYSNTPTSILSDTDDVTWDDTNKYFVCAAAGTYEVLGVVILEGGSSLVDLDVKRDGTAVLTGAPRVHSSVDPLEHTIRAVFTMTAGQNTNITYEATGPATVKAITGSTMTVKRLK